jgi:excinuclease UvrABC helicase subunit UvrB
MGDQPEAIAALIAGLREGKRYQVLRGITGGSRKCSHTMFGMLP